MTISYKYLTLANSTVSFKNKKILEVGGCTPSIIIEKFKPRQWVSVDLNMANVKKETKKNLHCDYIKYEYKNICDLEGLNETYDIVFSVNCFEHISDFKIAFENIYKLLKKNGYVFTVFGPLWSSHVGHHLSIESKFGELNFANNILSPWAHLKSKEKVYEEIEQNYDSETANRAVKYIYDSDDINRLHWNDYKNILDDSRFNIISQIIKRSGPQSNKFCRAREVLWFLKKGPVNMHEKINCNLRLYYNILKMLIKNHTDHRNIGTE